MILYVFFDVLNNIVVFFASGVAVWGVISWKRTIKFQKQFEFGFDLVKELHVIRFYLLQILNPDIMEHEREKALKSIEDITKLTDSASFLRSRVIYFRFVDVAMQLTMFKAKKQLFDNTFGDGASFDEIINFVEGIHVCSRDYSTHLSDFSNSFHSNIDVEKCKEVIQLNAKNVTEINLSQFDKALNNIEFLVLKKS